MGSLRKQLPNYYYYNYYNTMINTTIILQRYVVEAYIDIFDRKQICSRIGVLYRTMLGMGDTQKLNLILYWYC